MASPPIVATEATEDPDRLGLDGRAGDRRGFVETETYFEIIEGEVRRDFGKRSAAERDPLDVIKTPAA